MGEIDVVDSCNLIGNIEFPVYQTAGNHVSFIRTGETDKIVRLIYVCFSEMIGESLSNITTDIKHVQAVFASIYELSGKVKHQESVIANAMEEQNSGNQQILEAMHSITETTSLVRDGSAEMMIGGEQIVKEMKQLSDDTRNINESMNEISSYIMQISDAVESYLYNSYALSKLFCQSYQT